MSGELKTFREDFLFSEKQGSNCAIMTRQETVKPLLSILEDIHSNPRVMAILERYAPKLHADVLEASK